MLDDYDELIKSGDSIVDEIAPDLADRLVPPNDGGRSAPKVWFGPRGSLKHHSARFSVADTLLPFDPASLHPLA